MYDELIKNLRHDSASALQNCEFDFVHDWMLKAADAIEELSEERDMYIKAMADEHNRAARLAWEHRWIPVTERLPEYMENVLVTDGAFSGMGWRDYYDCHGTKPREDYWISPNTNVNDLGITHWMPLPEPPKDGEA